jgi:hypothetical protein
MKQEKRASIERFHSGVKALLQCEWWVDDDELLDVCRKALNFEVTSCSGQHVAFSRRDLREQLRSGQVGWLQKRRKLCAGIQLGDLIQRLTDILQLRNRGSCKASYLIMGCID